MYPRSYMVGAAAPPPGYMTKMANWPGGGVQPSPAIYTMDSQLRWAHHLDNNGQNIYAVNIPNTIHDPVIPQFLADKKDIIINFFYVVEAPACTLHCESK